MASTSNNKVISLVGWTLGIVLVDLLVVVYVTAHGFQSLTNGFMIGGFTLQLQWLPLIGVVMVALAVWSDAFTRIFPRWLGPESDPMARIRLLRVVTISLTAFVCFLYIPYLLGSNWFWLHLSHASHMIGQAQGFGNWLEALEMPILTMNPVWQYSISQVLASAALIFSTWVLARPAKRVRRIR